MSPFSLSWGMWLSAATPRIPGAKIYLTLTLLLVLYGTYTDSLTCFQCGATAESQPCIADWLVMANATTRHFYAKDCSANANWTRCMIQWTEKAGKILFFNRDCHDGWYFEKYLKSPLFYDLPSDNQTTCDMSGEEADTAICYTPCDGDFCNGPQLITEKNCTNTDSEECRAPGIFLTAQLVSLEILALLTSLLVVPWFMLGHH